MAWKLIAKLEKGLEFFAFLQHSKRRRRRNIFVLTEKC
jgi:hypothetical protein